MKNTCCLSSSDPIIWCLSINTYLWRCFQTEFTPAPYTVTKVKRLRLGFSRKTSFWEHFAKKSETKFSFVAKRDIFPRNVARSRNGNFGKRYKPKHSYGTILFCKKNRLKIQKLICFVWAWKSGRSDKVTCLNCPLYVIYILRWGGGGGTCTHNHKHTQNPPKLTQQPRKHYNNSQI